MITSSHTTECTLLPSTTPSKKDAASLARSSDADARALISVEIAKRLIILPIRIYKIKNSTSLMVAVREGQKEEARNLVRFLTNHEITTFEVPEDILKDALFIAYHAEGVQLEILLEQHALEIPSRYSSSSELSQSVVQGPVNTILTALLDYAIARNASDIYLFPKREGSFIKMRVNGEILSHRKPIGDRALHESLIRRLKVLASLSTSPLVKPADGAWVYQLLDREIPLRMSIMPTIHGEKVVLRILGNSAISLLPQLGFPHPTLNWLTHALSQSQGMIIFSGPTGSGKTTTLYASLRALIERGLHVVTLEDPVEQIIAGASQTSVGAASGLSYEEGLEGMLRQDPDCIMVGEIRTSRTASLAVQGSLTGHLVLTTLHGGSVIKVLRRMSTLTSDWIGCIEALQLIVCQRLIPALCPQCKVTDLALSKMMEQEVYRPVGCVACDYSGYASRAIAVEMLVITDEVREKLLSNKLSLSATISSMQKYFYPFHHALQDLLQRGIISPGGRR